MNTEEIRYTGRMITRYTIKYRRAKSMHEFEDAARYADYANNYVLALISATGDEFGVALATYCTDEGVYIEANTTPADHWVSG
jgi:hypothetical protein